MSRITSTLIAASLAAAGAVSAIAISSQDRADAGRIYEWSAEQSFSSDARRVRDQTVSPARPEAPFARIALESLT